MFHAFGVRSTLNLGNAMQDHSQKSEADKDSLAGVHYKVSIVKIGMVKCRIACYGMAWCSAVWYGVVLV